MDRTMTREQVEKACMDARDPATHDCQVTALIEAVSNNGHVYAKGDTFPMEATVAAAHIRAGQVSLAATPAKTGRP
jgi:hypothetical protein